MQKCLLTLGQAGLSDEAGAPYDFPIGKPFAILVYLALSDGPVSRDALAELFWNDVDRSRGRHSVRQALSFIRKRLGEDVFASDDPAALDPAVLTSDVAALEAALTAADAAALDARYAGPFLAPVQLASSPEWDHWVEARRAVLAERTAAVLHRAAVQERDPERAERWLRRAVEIESHRAAHRVALIDRLLERGDLESATAALAEARQGEVDDRKVMEAASERIATFRARRQPDPQADLPTPAFVGRSRELAALADRWKRARSGRRELAILAGPTGIGKTRLAEELAALVTSGGGGVAQVKASASERRLEWSVTAELIRSLYPMPGAAGISGGTEAVLQSLVPSLGSAAAGTRAAASPVAISDALADLIEAVAYEAPLLVVLDDMQWVDPSSVALLMRAARQIRLEPVMVVFTFRSEEVSSRGFAYAESLIREERALYLQLDPLSASEVEELLALSGVEEGPDRLQQVAARLHTVSRGHPLFLVELLRSLVADGVLVADEGRWSLRGKPPEELALPASMRGLITKRLEQLGDDARRVGRAVAGLPRGVRIDRIRGRTGLTDDAFTAGLNELLSRDVVRWDAKGRLVFSHDQLREAMAGKDRRPKRWATAAAAVLALALTGALALVLGSGPPSPPFGGGTLIVETTSDSILAYRVEAERNPRLERLTEPPFWVPDPLPNRYGHLGARRLTDGRVLWYGRTQDPLDAPNAVIYHPDGPPEVVIDRPGDDGIRTVSPDGRRMIASIEHLETPQYDLVLQLRSLTGDDARIVAGPTAGTDAAWSDDGRRIAATLAVDRDTLVILTPTLERVASHTAFSFGGLEWCGGSGLLLVHVQDSATSRPRRVLFDPITAEEQLLDEEPIYRAVCSPDGSAVLGARSDRGRTIWHLHDLATDEVHSIPDGVPGNIRRISWLPDSVPPIPAQLDIAPDSMRVVHGTRTDVAISVVLDDGGRIHDPEVVWRTEDPGIASVLGDGRISANRVGSTRLIASHDGWLEDTVIVGVVGGDQPTLGLADDFLHLDTARWYLVGQPVAEPALVDGEPALELLGDGRYADGIVSRTTFSLARGATLDSEIRFPLTARELQKITICIAGNEPPADLAALPMMSRWQHGHSLCFHYPAYELWKWSPDVVRFGSSGARWNYARFPDGVDVADWVRVGLQVLPDGEASLWLDGQQVARTVISPELLASPVRVQITAGTHGTRGFVRGLRFWTEPRYR